MQTIDRGTLKTMIDNDREMILIDVLSPESFEDFHLPGAINIPVGTDDFEKRAEGLADKDARIVVYCKDADCNASPRAAKRLEELGFSNVHDYAAGKADWRAAGLPTR